LTGFTPVKYAPLISAKNLTLNHLPELQGRLGKQDFLDFVSGFPEESRKQQSPSAKKIVSIF
jgi:hypothetical protein